MDPATLDTIAKLGPIATGLAAIVALIVGLVAITQKSRADRRDQWWKRTQLRRLVCSRPPLGRA